VSVPNCKTLVFIHGWASAPEIWQRQREYFGKHYEVILPDISRAKDIQEAAGIVNDSIKGKKDFILIGWSLGWLSFLEWLKNITSESPSRYEVVFRYLPKGVIAVNSTAKFCDDGYLGKGPTETHLAKMIRDCKRDPRKTVEDFYKGMLTDIGKNALNSLKIKNIAFDTLAQGLYMLKNCDYRDFIARIHFPTLIIAGAKDAICVPEASEYMHKKIKGSELKVFDCGHMPFIDKADGFNAAIDNFIKLMPGTKSHFSARR